MLRTLSRRPLCDWELYKGKYGKDSSPIQARPALASVMPWHEGYGMMPMACVTLTVHVVRPTPVPSWDRRAPARLRKPRWRVAVPGKTLENWQRMYETDI